MTITTEETANTETGVEVPIESTAITVGTEAGNEATNIETNDSVEAGIDISNKDLLSKIRVKEGLWKKSRINYLLFILL